MEGCTDNFGLSEQDLNCSMRLWRFFLGRFLLTVGVRLGPPQRDRGTFGLWGNLAWLKTGAACHLAFQKAFERRCSAMWILFCISGFNKSVSVSFDV